MACDNTKRLNSQKNIMNITEKSDNYVITKNDNERTIVCTKATAGTVTLPLLSENIGRIITIVRTGNGAIVVSGTDGETIGTASSYTLASKGATITVQALATDWIIISEI